MSDAGHDDDRDSAEAWVNDITLVAAVLGSISINPMRELTDDEHDAYQAAVARLREHAELSDDHPVMGTRLFLPGGPN